MMKKKELSITVSKRPYLNNPRLNIVQSRVKSDTILHTADQNNGKPKRVANSEPK